MKKAKKNSKLSDQELKEYSVIAADSILLYDALFDEPEKGLIDLAKELATECKRRENMQ